MSGGSAASCLLRMGLVSGQWEGSKGSEQDSDWVRLPFKENHWVRSLRIVGGWAWKRGDQETVVTVIWVV